MSIRTVMALLRYLVRCLHRQGPCQVCLSSHPPNRAGIPV